MTEGTFSRKLRFIACIVGCWLGLAATVSAADIQMEVQAAPGQPSAVKALAVSPGLATFSPPPATSSTAAAATGPYARGTLTMR